MFRLWAKEFRSNHMLRDMVVENASPDLNRTKKFLPPWMKSAMNLIFQNPYG